MRLSHDTIALLRNFSKINTGLGFEKGDLLRTVNPQKTILAVAKLDDECPAEACIHSLKDFLRLIARSENPLQLNFDTTASDDFPDGCVNIQEVQTLKSIGSVRFCSSDYVKTPPKNHPSVERDLAFDLTAADLAYLKTRPEKCKSEIWIRICSSGDTVRLEKKIEHSILGFIEVRNTVTDTAPFERRMETEHLKCLMPGPYSVHIAQKGVAHFLYKGFPLEYWLALGVKSK